MRLYRAWLHQQRLTQSPEARASVKDDERVVIEPYFDTGRIATVAHCGGCWCGGGAARPPPPHPPALFPPPFPPPLPLLGGATSPPPLPPCRRTPHPPAPLPRPVMT